MNQKNVRLNADHSNWWSVNKKYTSPMIIFPEYFLWSFVLSYKAGSSS